MDDGVSPRWILGVEWSAECAGSCATVEVQGKTLWSGFTALGSARFKSSAFKSDEVRCTNTGLSLRSVSGLTVTSSLAFGLNASWAVTPVSGCEANNRISRPGDIGCRGMEADSE